MAVTRFFAPALLVTLGVLLITIWLDFNEEKPLRPLGSIARFNDNPGRNKDYITRQRKQDLYITGTSFLSSGNACTKILSLQGRSISAATFVRQSRTTQNVFGPAQNGLNKKNTGIVDFEVDNKVICDGGLKSEILNSQFSSVFTKEDLGNIPEMGSDSTPGLGPLIISEQGVLKQLSSLNPNKAYGPNSTRFLKTYAADIAPILTDISQDSIESGSVPHRWKEAGDFWRTLGYSPRPIALFIIFKRLTRQCAIIN